MYKFRLVICVALVAFSVAFPAQATPLISATFTGQATGNTPFLGLTWGDSVTGSVIYDEGLLAGHTLGYANLSLQEPYSAFSIALGNALNFTLATDSSGTIGLPAIQFNNGNFNGFAYNSDFTNNGQTYRFRISGGLWFINDFNPATGIPGRQRQTGWIGSSLGNVQTYTPPVSDVPEPATVMLLAAGLAGVFAIRGRHFIARG